MDRNIDHDIICVTSLKLFNATYKLTGIVVHQGLSKNSGHYYTITRCWETGKAYMLNDAEFTKQLPDEVMDEEMKKKCLIKMYI